jgi:hypothetical protein
MSTKSQAEVFGQEIMRNSTRLALKSFTVNQLLLQAKENECKLKYGLMQKGIVTNTFKAISKRMRDNLKEATARYVWNIWFRDEKALIYG